MQKSESAEDWWTGRLNGEQGVFPGKSCHETINSVLTAESRQLCAGDLGVD